MREVWLTIVLVIFCMGLAGCSGKAEVPSNAAVEESVLKSGSKDSSYVELTKIKDDIWVHTTYTDYSGSRTPSNGLLINTPEGLVLIDTPWNEGQTEELIKLAKSKFSKDIATAIITHAHSDRIGGISTLLKNKVDVRSTSLTAQLAEKGGFEKPVPSLDSEPDVKVGDVRLETFYPGEGHSSDNIVVWLPKYKVLFAGCIVKAMDSENIGSTTDANIEQWPESVKKLLEKYSEAEVVIPGHGNWGGTELIEHTLDLLGK